MHMYERGRAAVDAQVAVNEVAVTDDVCEVNGLQLHWITYWLCVQRELLPGRLCRERAS